MDDTRTTLLVAERDENTRAFLLDNLAADGYEPLSAHTVARPGGASVDPRTNRRMGPARWRWRADSRRREATPMDVTRTRLAEDRR
jgi:hypothetical protein